jgi:hypothetical protein
MLDDLIGKPLHNPMITNSFVCQNGPGTRERPNRQWERGPPERVVLKLGDGREHLLDDLRVATDPGLNQDGDRREEVLLRRRTQLTFQTSRLRSSPDVTGRGDPPKVPSQVLESMRIACKHNHLPDLPDPACRSGGFAPGSRRPTTALNKPVVSSFLMSGQ